MSLSLKIDHYPSIHDWLAEHDLILKPDWFTPKRNVEPYSPLWTVYSSFSKKKMMPAEWAMNPNWAKKGQIPRPLTVARAETVYERVSFKALIKRYRALVPVTGFMSRSLSRNKDGRYVLYEFSDKQNEAFALAALYQFNVDGNMQIVILTKAVKVPSLNKTMRVPLVVPHKKVTEWLESEKKVGIANWLENYQFPQDLTLKLIQ